MHELVAYRFSTTIEEAQEVSGNLSSLDKIDSVLDVWIRSKSEGKDWAGEESVVLPGGRKGVVTQKKVIAPGKGEMHVLDLREEVPGGIFRTRMEYGNVDGVLEFYASLSSQSAGIYVAPVQREVHCPRAIRDVIDLGFGWKVGEMPVPRVADKYAGRAEGELLADFLLNEKRVLPVVVISVEPEGTPFHPNLSSWFVNDLTGLAQVVEIDRDASFGLSGKVTNPRSCYGGAVRIYWPLMLPDASDGQTHPFQTPKWLLEKFPDRDDAARYLRSFVRNRIFDTAASSVTAPAFFSEIVQTADYQRFEKLRAEAKGGDDLLRLYEEENIALQRRVEELKADKDSLRNELYRLKTQEDIEKYAASVGEVQSPPATIEEAVNRARLTLSNDLYFGGNVPDSIKTLLPEAGPPPKVFDYLEALALLASELREKSGSIGTSMGAWLLDNGVKCSGESETILNDKSKMLARTWDDGRDRRTFELHLKPSDSIASNRCVRIYFDWDRTREMIVVAYVGKHLD